MSFSGTSAIEIYYSGLDSTLGCFVNDPETGHYIVLRRDLDQRLMRQVYDHLQAYCQGLQDDSPYWLYQHVVCYEDLVPPEALPMTIEPEIIILGAITRSFRIGSGAGMRVIGKAG